RHERERHEAEADTVAALLGVELAGAVSDAARDRTDDARQPDPQGRGRAEHPLEGSTEGTRTRLGSRGLARGLLARRRLLAGLAAGRPLARRGRRSGRHARKAKPEPETSHGPTP